MNTPLGNEDIEQAMRGVHGFRGVSSYDLLSNMNMDSLSSSTQTTFYPFTTKQPYLNS